jgi:hypothetical protein
MARTSWRTLEVGDLISIPVDESRIAIGHVIEAGREPYLCVYQPLFAAAEVTPDLSGVEIALIARTGDELLWHGRWKVVGRQELPTNIPRPYHVVGTPDGLRLQTFDGKDVRAANEQDLIAYGYQFSVSNIKFSKIMRHIHGIEPYPDDYSKLTYGVSIKRSSLA